MRFSIKLKELRVEKNLTQAQLAAKLKVVSQSAIAKWELEKTIPTADALILLSEFFDVSVDYLLGIEDEFGNKINKNKRK